MRKMVILGSLILFFAPIVWAQERSEVPVWSVGDKWTYKDVNGETWTDEVQDIKEDLYVVKMGGVRDLYASWRRGSYHCFDKKTLNLRYLVNENGRRVKYTGVGSKHFNFPLIVGKKWMELTQIGFDNPEFSADFALFVEYKVEGIEEVTTAAGTRKAYKIYLKPFASIFSSFYSDPYWWYRFWYSSEVKTWIKCQAGPWLGPPAKAPDAELFSYEIKPMAKRPD